MRAPKKSYRTSRVVEIKSTNSAWARTILRVSGVNYEGNDTGYESLEKHFGDSLAR